MMSHVPSGRAMRDFPNGLKFFLDQGRVHPDFSFNPQNSRMSEPPWAHKDNVWRRARGETTSRKHLIFCQFTHSPRSGTEGSKSYPGTRPGTGPTPVCWQSSRFRPPPNCPQFVLPEHHTPRVPLNWSEGGGFHYNNRHGPVCSHPSSPGSTGLLGKVLDPFP